MVATIELMSEEGGRPGPAAVLPAEMFLRAAPAGVLAAMVAGSGGTAPDKDLWVMSSRWNWPDSADGSAGARIVEWATRVNAHLDVPEMRDDTYGVYSWLARNRYNVLVDGLLMRQLPEVIPGHEKAVDRLPWTPVIPAPMSTIDTMIRWGRDKIGPLGGLNVAVITPSPRWLSGVAADAERVRTESINAVAALGSVAKSPSDRTPGQGNSWTMARYMFGDAPEHQMMTATQAVAYRMAGFNEEDARRNKFGSTETR